MLSKFIYLFGAVPMRSD